MCGLNAAKFKIKFKLVKLGPNSLMYFSWNPCMAAFNCCAGLKLSERDFEAAINHLDGAL